MTRWLLCVGISAGMLVAQQTKTAPKVNPGVEHVIEALSSGASEDLIIETLRSEGKAYTLTIADLAKLKKAGASDNVIRAMKSPKAEAVPSTPVGVNPTSDSAGSIPKHYDIDWLYAHCSWVTAVSGKQIYLEYGALPGKNERLRVFKLVVTVKDVSGHPVEINPGGVGEVVITESRPGKDSSSPRMVGT